MLRFDRNSALRTEQAVEAARRTQSGRVRAQLADLYPYKVGHGASPGIAQARDSIRDLLSS
ncbi:hypothetical protein V1J52_04040 [Streptomyces sp. TRM 70351]|uniref:hypothetical protein n=1 Tax=Streptomyces sp. TRM 70351 TaxID=3116552 RepID=UPI002E7AF930|nr:hypothetical protein [Streptomyces sp. TRM 70351]MEE1927360.1 hypothetical protein [Streptomyces sp. TRM 70351]